MKGNIKKLLKTHSSSLTNFAHDFDQKNKADKNKAEGTHTKKKTKKGGMYVL